MVTTQTFDERDRALAWIDNAAAAAGQPRAELVDLILFTTYIHEILSHFSLGFCGCSFRHNRTDVLMTVKAVDGGTPLVVFVTSATATGCISKFLDLLETDRLSWVKDRYPWI